YACNSFNKLNVLGYDPGLDHYIKLNPITNRYYSILRMTVLLSKRIDDDLTFQIILRLDILIVS
ncbi:hypothetical protein L9F63_022070, partial [Diploptera punctata]